MRKSALPPASAKKLKPTVLVVDDSPEMRTYYSTLLEAHLYHVQTATTGLEALQLLGDGLNPDVVILDLEMPQLDGMCTLQRVRNLCPTLQVIMCSGIDDPEKAHQAITLGAAAYLTKPVRFLHIRAALERCLDHNGRVQIEPSSSGPAEFPRTHP